MRSGAPERLVTSEFDNNVVAGSRESLISGKTPVILLQELSHLDKICKPNSQSWVIERRYSRALTRYFSSSLAQRASIEIGPDLDNGDV